MLDLILSRGEINQACSDARDDLGTFLGNVKANLVSIGSPSSSSSPVLREIVNESLDVFVSTYYALANRLSKADLFNNEPRRGEIIWNYALSTASTAVLNYINMVVGDQISIAPNEMMASLLQEKSDRRSRYSSISSALTAVVKATEKMNADARYNGSQRSRINALADYFASLETSALNQAISACRYEQSGLELRSLDVRTTSDKISFEKVKVGGGVPATAKDKTGSGETVLEGDDLPTALPRLERNNAQLSRVAGNEEAIRLFQESFLGVLHYSVPDRFNYKFQDGEGYPEIIGFVGLAGVGKTLTFHACMNWGLDFASKYRINIFPFILSSLHYGSSYLNRTPRLIETYNNLIRLGDMIKVGGFDEADDIVPIGPGGVIDAHGKQNLNALKRSTGNANSVGSSLTVMIFNGISIEEDIPAELKDRIRFVYLPGPQTPDEFAKIIRGSLEEKERAGKLYDVDWHKVGEMMVDANQTMLDATSNRMGIGRAYKIIAQKLALTTRKSAMEYAGQVLGKSPEFHREFYANEFLPVGQNDIDNAIQETVDEQLQLLEYKGVRGG